MESFVGQYSVRIGPGGKIVFKMGVKNLLEHCSLDIRLDISDNSFSISPHARSLHM